MNADDARTLARRFLALPLEKRRIFLAGLQREGVDFAQFPIPAQVPVAERGQLSYAQQRMWVLWQLDPQSAAYNLPSAVRLKGPLVVEALQAAFASLVERHETLRSVFEQDAHGEVRQVPMAQEPQVQHLDLGALPPDAREARVKALAEAQSLQPFDLASGPLLRVQLLKLAADEHVLLLTLHHIVSDGWSMNVLIEEFSHLYGAHLRGVAPALAALPIQYSDYALWQRCWLEAGEKERQLAYWRAQLGEAHPPLELPLDRPRPAVPSYRGRRHAFAIEPALAEQLGRLAGEQGVTLFMLLLGAFNILLYRYTGQGDLRVGVPIANRNRSDVEGLIGVFVNTQVLRAQLDGQMSVVQLLGAIKQAAVGAQAHQDLPFEQLVEALALERSLSHTPLFQVMYNHQPQVADVAQLNLEGGLQLSQVQWESRTSQFDLTLDTYEQGGRLHAVLGYASDLFDPASIVRMGQHWLALLRGMLADPQQRIEQLPMLAPEEYQRIVLDCNATTQAYPLQQPLHRLIEAQVERSPEATALLFGGQALSYRALNARANQLAHCLLAAGVGPDSLVGIALERSLEMVVGLLATLKAGAAYVPFDPEYPAERLAYMVEDSAVQWVLTQAQLVERLPLEGVRRLVLGEGGVALDGFSDANPQVVVDPRQLAYVIYTSGSTGRPKGAGNSHAALVNRLCWMQQAYPLEARDTVLQKTPFSFDVSVWEFFWPLMTGARLAVAGPGDHRDPAKLVALIEQHQVTTLHFVPSMLQVFLQSLDSPQSLSASARPAPTGADALAVLRRIICSGEALPVDAQLQVFAKLPKVALYNLYGPTEAAIDVTHWTCIDEGRDSVPIGQPIANLHTYVLDASLAPVPPGVSGELYLGGQGLARGYHRRPALTAERFVSDPFGSGGRLYRTGDRVRQREDGVIEYLGRFDHQVKIRGLRIELGEIEARLAQHALVREAVVLAHDGRQLVAYLVLAANPDGWPQQLKDWLLQALPEFMVPSHLLSLDRLPLTANGKLDRKALPAPHASVRNDYAAPQNATQQQLATLWQSLLGVAQVGLDDNFFELGGDSIIAIQLVSRARQLGLHYTPRDLFQYQTVRSLAAVAGRGTQVQAEQGPLSGSVELTPIQHAFFAQTMAVRSHWNQSLLLTPRQVLDAASLRSAVGQLLQQHDALRLRFSERPEGWQQYHADAALDASFAVAEAADRDALAALCEQTQRSLDLAQGPLLRALLVQLGDGSQRLLLVIHHLVVDGVSWRVLLEDLQLAYQQQPLAAKTSAWQAWAARLPALAQQHSVELAYWRAQSVPGELPVDYPQGDLSNRSGRTLDSRFDAELTRQLLQLAPAAYRTQVNDLLLTALARVVARWSGQDAALLQLEGHGREDVFADIDLSRTVGWFTTLFPLRLTPAGGLGESIKAIKEQLRAVPGKGLGFGLLRYLGSDVERATLADLTAPRITFNYLGQFDQQFDAQALWAPAAESSGVAQDEQAPLANWLTVEGQVYGGELGLRWGYSAAMYPPQTIAALAADFEQELRALVAHCCQLPVAEATPSDFPLARLSQAALDTLPVPLAALSDIYGVSPMQQGMLFHSLLEEDAGNYINQLRLSIDGLDPQRFQAAWQATLAAHDILRTGFAWQGALEQPVQVVYRDLELPFVSLDWRGREALAQALDALAASERERGFDLLAAPLLRLQLVRTAEQAYHLIYTHHHVLMDGWSNARLLGEVLQRYSGQVPTVASGRYRDYIAWLQRQDALASEAFWRERLAPLPGPTRLARSLPCEQPGSGFADHYRQLSVDRLQQLNAFARAQKVTLNTVVQAAWLLLLQRYSGQSTVCFGATVAGRPAALAGVEQQIGLFINTLPVIASPPGDQRVGDWLQAVQALNLSLRDHEHTPLVDIQGWFGQGGAALFDNILVFDNYPLGDALQQAGSDLRFGAVDHREHTHYALTLAVGQGQGLSLHFSYDRGQFEAQAIEALAGHLDCLLEGVCGSAERALGNLALVTPEALRQGQECWNATATAYPLQRSVQALIEAQVERAPDAPALVLDEVELTYAELNARANQLAHRLIEAGVGPDVLVGIAAERSLDMVVGLLGVLKAGGAYVPLDPEYPEERLAYMFEDSGIRLLLTQRHLLEALPIPASLATLLLDESLDDYATHNPNVEVTGENLAYVIYTSGSTGKPKGAGNRHSALTNRLCWMQQAYGLDGSDTVLQKTPFSFDVSVWEFFWPLMTGARLALAAPGDHRDPAKLVELIERHQVTTLHFVPSMLQVFLQSLPESMEAGSSVGAGLSRGRARSARQESHSADLLALRSRSRDESGRRTAAPTGGGGVRRIICSGEALPVDAQLQVFAKLPEANLYNLYGPTEAAIDVTHWTCVDEGRDGVPIGHPIANLSTFILDPELNPVPVGVIGELYLGGEGLARGYHRRPGLTAERFMTSPFGNGERLYRTGDLARYRADGVIEYAGRIDHQVKIRGLRIELGEIEARLNEQDPVREGVVLALPGASGQQLVGYVVPTDTSADESVLREQIKTRLKEHLPDYMVPAQWVFLGEFPLSPNGKLERKALPKPDASQGHGGYRAPQSELEQHLALIWQEVLQVSRVSLDDDFYQLGGNSLQLVMLQSRLRAGLARDVQLRDIQGLRTLAELAAYLETTPSEEGLGSELDLIFDALDELEENHA
ncbi:non-ribosomal peptide synthetase [Pseudomonas sp. SDI]|uniref:non-ribosomal peptide synthetase n=1 Tax=Pseudomonas sp. SDI TaxID=2170734 RepID=UPI000DE78EBF|nr:non-ribosomal peptide synthetase [Pseudomonas sp. SDI]PWB30938.1 non-ribosomal peptide synthetase [Pseudomonas sp. SDI]